MLIIQIVQKPKIWDGKSRGIIVNQLWCPISKEKAGERIEL